MFTCYHYKFLQISFGSTIWSGVRCYLNACSAKGARILFSFVGERLGLKNAYIEEWEVFTAHVLPQGGAESCSAAQNITSGANNRLARGNQAVSPRANGKNYSY